MFKYEGNQIVVASKGDGFQDFKSQFEDDARAFGYIRIQVGLIIFLYYTILNITVGNGLYIYCTINLSF